MARVTVEDCIDKITNRFELILLAGHRARTISQGAALTIDRDNDKNPVVALREVAEQTVDPEDLKEDLIHSMQKHVEVDEPEEEFAPALPDATSAEQATADPAMVEGEQEDTPDTYDRLTEDELLRGLEGK